MSITSIRNTRFAQLLVALAAATSLAGGLGALAADDAHAMRCSTVGGSTYACGDDRAETYANPRLP